MQLNSTGGTFGFFASNKPELLQSNTRAEVIAFINSGALITGKVYCLPTTWVLAGGTGTWCGIATSATALGTRGWYESPALNPGKPWPADYDINSDRIYWMHSSEQYENEVSGDTEVRNFPWNNSRVNRNKVHHATLTFTSSGTFSANVLNSDARLEVSGSANVYRSQFTSYSNSTIQGGQIEDSVISDDSRLLMNGGFARQLSIGSGAYYDLQGWTGTIQNSRSNRGRVYLSGTGTVQNISQDSYSVFYIRNVASANISDVSAIGYGVLYIDGANAPRVQYVTLQSAGYLYARNSVNLSVQRCTIQCNSYLYADSSDRFQAIQWSIDSGTIVYARRATGILRNLGARDYARLNIDDADLSRDWRYITMDSGASIDARNSNARLRYASFSDNAYLRFVNGSPNINQSKFFALARVYLNSQNNLFSGCSIGRCYLNTEGSGNGVNFYNTSLASYAYVDLRDAPSGRLDYVNVTGYSRIRVRGTASAGWRIYSTEVNSEADLRIASAGDILNSHFASRAIATFTHTGTVQRAFVMQITTTQTTNSTNLRLHSGGAF